MKETVDYVLKGRIKILELDSAIVGQSSSFDSWIMGAAPLKADLTTSVLPTLRTKGKKRFFCIVLLPNLLVLRQKPL
ncbi:hypothetical protein Plhal304r1_c039g0116941 [Plasmopara halstedii]